MGVFTQSALLAQTGDIIGGVTLVFLRDVSLNNNGDVAFNAGFSDGGFGIVLAQTSAVPEPSSLLLLGSGLIGFAGWRWRQGRTVTS